MYSRVITLSKMDVDKYICCRIGNHIVVDMTYLYTILVTWRQRGRTSLEMHVVYATCLIPQSKNTTYSYSYEV